MVRLTLAGPSFGSVISPLANDASISRLITSASVKFATGNELEQRERCAVERMIAAGRSGCWRVRISRIRARPCRRRQANPIWCCSGARMVAIARSEIVGRLRVSATSHSGAVAIGTSLPQR